MFDGKNFSTDEFPIQNLRRCTEGFYQEDKWGNEHAIMLNEFFNDAKRKDKDLIVTAIDVTNAFGSVSHVLIMSTLR
jgi:hypothetical protein